MSKTTIQLRSTETKRLFTCGEETGRGRVVIRDDETGECGDVAGDLCTLKGAFEPLPYDAAEAAAILASCEKFTPGMFELPE